jgi:predicted deacylase
MKRILLISGIHGDELSGPHILFEFLQKIEQCPELEFEFLPFLNPSGFLKGTRENEDGKDLNRWFFDKPKKDEPKECSLIKEFFDSESYDFLISFHEDPEIEDFYLYNDTNHEKDSPLIQSIFETVNSFGVEFYNGVDNDEDGMLSENGYIGPSPTDGEATLEAYLLRNEKVKEALTIEIPGLLDLEKKIALGKAILETILKSMEV